MTIAQVEAEPAKQSTTPRRRSRRTWIILLVVVVAIVVVIAGVAFYVLNSGYGSDGAPPTAYIGHDLLPNGFNCTFGYWTTGDSGPVSWSWLVIRLTEGTNNASWNMNAQDLNTGTSVTHDYGASRLGPLTVFLSVHDIAGNGCADWQDSFEITTGNGAFSNGEIYVVFVLFQPANLSTVCSDFIIWGEQ